MKQITIFTALIAALFFITACTDVETIDRKTVTPQEQNPALWAKYLASLRAYKSSKHYLTYARLENAPEVSTSPKDFLKALPDSLDYIALMRPLSAFDREDLPLLQSKGTKVLAWADCSDAATASSAVDAALGQIAEYDLDGIVVAFRGNPDDASAAVEGAIASKIAALNDKVVLFEGNPAFVAAGNRDKYDFYVLDTSETNNVFTVREEVDYTIDRLGIPASKLLLAAAPADKIDNNLLKPVPALGEIAKCVMAYGPLAGLGIFDTTADYYSPNVSYPRTKGAINLLNPAYK